MVMKAPVAKRIEEEINRFISFRFFKIVCLPFLEEVKGIFTVFHLSSLILLNDYLGTKIYR